MNTDYREKFVSFVQFVSKNFPGSTSREGLMRRLVLGVMLGVLAAVFFSQRAILSLKERLWGNSQSLGGEQILTERGRDASPYDIPLPNYDELGSINSWRYMWQWTPIQSTVLDVGCSTGYLGAWLAQTRDCVVDGVELNAGDREIAAQRLRHIYPIDLERDSWHTRLPNRYDVVLLMDVLEHVRNSDQLLCEVKWLLKPEGILIVNVPNGANWQLRFSLLRGRWDYQETGLLDRTHVHFYTIATLRRKLERNGWRITELRPTLPADRLFGRDFGTSHWGKRLIRSWCRAFPGLLAYQIIIRAKPA